jgi:hypothetical protein
MLAGRTIRVPPIRNESIMKRERIILAIIRSLACICSIGAVIAVAFFYDDLPARMPVTRWSTASKTWLIALRIPVVNLCMTAFAVILSCSLQRLPGNRKLWLSGAILLTIAATKSIAEAIELSKLPAKSKAAPIMLVASVAIGLISALWIGRHDLSNGAWRHLEFTSGEKKLSLALAAVIALMNAPIVFA